MKVGDEVYLRDDPTVKGVIDGGPYFGYIVSVRFGCLSLGYKKSELILVSEYEKENMKDNWIEWSGGEMPIQKGTKITVKHRDRSVLDDFAGGIYSHDWYHTGSHADIVAYMIHEKKGHPNASILMDIAKEAAINPEYWKEFQFYGNNFRWESLNDEDDLLGAVGSDWEVRRKPRTMRIGNYDVPEPKGFMCNCGKLLIKFETKEGADLMLKALQELLAGK